MKDQSAYFGLTGNFFVDLNKNNLYWKSNPKWSLEPRHHLRSRKAYCAWQGRVQKSTT